MRVETSQRTRPAHAGATRFSPAPAIQGAAFAPSPRRTWASEPTNPQDFQSETCFVTALPWYQPEVWHSAENFSSFNVWSSSAASLLERREASINVCASSSAYSLERHETNHVGFPDAACIILAASEALRGDMPRGGFASLQARRPSQRRGALGVLFAHPAGSTPLRVEAPAPPKPSNEDGEVLAGLEAARAKLAAIRAALPEVDWESDRQTNRWLDEQFQAMGRKKLVPSKRQP